MTRQDPVEGRQRETNLKIMSTQDPIEGRQRETNLETMTKQEPVKGRQREANLEIMSQQDPIEGRQRETNLEIMTKQEPVGLFDNAYRMTHTNERSVHESFCSHKRQTFVETFTRRTGFSSIKSALLCTQVMSPRQNRQV